MTGLIRAELSRLIKSRSLLVCSILAAALGVGFALLYKFFWDENKTISMTYTMMQTYGMSTDVLDEALKMIPRDNLWSYINVFMSDSMIWILSSVCACTFAASEHDMGTLKNPVSRGCKRWKIYFSKYISSFLIVLMISIFYIAAGGITAMTFVSESPTISMLNMVICVLLYIMLFAALAGFYLMLSVIFRRSGFTVAAALVVPMLVSALMGTASMISDDIGYFARYMLVESFTYVQNFVLEGQAFIPALTALAYIAATSVIGYLVFGKREIK